MDFTYERIYMDDELPMFLLMTSVQHVPHHGGVRAESVWIQNQSAIAAAGADFCAGQPFLKYLHDIRLEHAVKYLVETDLPVTL